MVQAKPPPTGTSEPTSGEPSKGLARLPHIASPKFSGAYTEWPSFRDLFTSLDIGNATLSNATRLQYLQSAVEGQAAETIAHITITEANFGTAWSLLTQKFENKRAIVSAHLRDLLTLPLMTGASAAELQRLRAITNQALSLLANLEHWDDIIVTLTTMKLDPELMEEWELSLGVSTDALSYAELDRFMKARIQSVDAARPAKEHAIPDRSQTGKSSRGSVARVCTTNPAPGPSSHGTRSQCPVCRTRHALYRCMAFKALRLEQRREIAADRLAPGHMAPSCPVAATCSRCGRRHHSLLHPPTSDTTCGDDGPVAGPLASGSLPSAAALSSIASPASTDGAPVLLATAIVGVRSSGGDLLTVRALLDQGAQVSLVSESVVQTLRLLRQPHVTNFIGALDGNLGASQSQVKLTLAPPAGTTPAAINIIAHVVPKVSSYVPEWPPTTQRKDFEGLNFADPDPSARRPIDLIVGANYFGALLLPGLRRGTPWALIAQQTVLG
ncbi:uncharacterized protein LOC143377089 [Andrena cerasifolii]|uniref:uncharacterized protein LOC143377089 n=1 Tax=Andrena cerasifolii TaxID=2819439 RepID=UPI00403775E5